MGGKTKILVVTAVALFVALTALILGFWIAGFDVLGWFTTKWAIIVYVCVGFYLSFVLGVVVREYFTK